MLKCFSIGQYKHKTAFFVFSGKVKFMSETEFSELLSGLHMYRYVMTGKYQTSVKAMKVQCDSFREIDAK